MTLDTSAILAVLLDEPERAAFVGRIEQADRRLVSTMTVLVAAMVLEGRKGDDAGHDLDQFLARGDIEVDPFDQELAHARTVFQRFGKGGIRLDSTSATARPTRWRSGLVSRCSSRARISAPPTCHSWPTETGRTSRCAPATRSPITGSCATLDDGGRGVAFPATAAAVRMTVSSTGKS